MNSSIQEHFSNEDIITIGCENQLQRRNTLKGLAMQKLVKLAMKHTDEDISVKRIFEKLLEQQIEYFIVNKPFKIQKNRFLRKWSYVHQEDFEDYLEIWIREQTIKKDWKICNYCGLRIRSSQQFSSKCKKCNKGWFQLATDEKTQWVLKNKGSKERTLTYLLREGFLKKIQLRKRVDFFHYLNGVFSIYEAKNKEITGLTPRDLQKTLIYPFIVQRSGFQVNELIVIYNGKITQELFRQIQKGYGVEFTFKIKLWSIGTFLSYNNIHVKGILVKQHGRDYNYEIIPGIASKLVIDLRLLD